MKRASLLLVAVLSLLATSFSLSAQRFTTVLCSNYFGVAPSPTSPILATKTFYSSAHIPASPVTGTRNILVILIDFPNRVGSKNSTYFQNLLFSNNVGSLKSYYEEASYGQFTVNGTIASTGWYRSAKNITWWGADASTTSYDDKNEPIYNLAKEALGKADADVNFETYDKDGDGVLQANELSIWVVHAGAAQESTGNTNDIYSHYWSILGVGFNSFTDFYVDGVRLSKHFDGENVCGYAMEAEYSPVGTFAHEFGHDLGLPDLYNTGIGEEFVGRWGIMATGSWNGNPQGSSPAHFTSWSKIKLGWINVSAITTVSTKQVVNITINQLETSNVSIIMVPTGSTYYLIEARKRIFFDSSLPSYGVLILYCDDSIGSGNGSVRVINANPSDTTLDQAAFNVGGNVTFVDSSRGITITVLSASNSSFKVRVNYNAGNFRISTQPLGLIIQVDGINHTSPYVFTWASGSTHTISVPNIQWNESVRYLFQGWSDGGSRTHTVIANTSDLVITANYLVQYFLTVSSLYGVTSGSGWYDNDTVAYVALNVGVIGGGNGSRLRFAYWGGNASGMDFNRSNPILMDGIKSTTANWKMQYELVLNFKTGDGNSWLSPSQCQITGASPNNTVITLNSFSHVWLDDVRWSLIQVLWQKNNIVPPVSSSYRPTALGKWVVNCSVYNRSFEDAFKASDGSTLYTRPSSFRMVFPNNTLSLPLSPVSGYFLQNGSYELRSVYWQGSDVTPINNIFTFTSPSAVSFNCRIYNVDFTGSFKDSKGLDLSIRASGFSLLSPNGSSTGLLPIGSHMLQNGTFKLHFISWKGFEVLPTSNFFNSVDGNPSVNCAVSDVTITVKDILGLTISGAKITMVYVANGTAIATTTTNLEGKAIFPQLPDSNYLAEVTFLGSVNKIFTLSGDKVVEVIIFLSYPIIVVLLSIAVVSVGIMILVVRRRYL